MHGSERDVWETRAFIPCMPAENLPDLSQNDPSMYSCHLMFPSEPNQIQMVLRTNLDHNCYSTIKYFNCVLFPVERLVTYYEITIECNFFCINARERPGEVISLHKNAQFVCGAGSWLALKISPQGNQNGKRGGLECI